MRPFCFQISHISSFFRQTLNFINGFVIDPLTLLNFFGRISIAPQSLPNHSAMFPNYSGFRFNGSATVSEYNQMFRYSGDDCFNNCVNVFNQIVNESK